MKPTAASNDGAALDNYKEVLPVLRQKVSEHPELAQEDDTVVIGNVIAMLHPCPLKK